MCFFDLAYESVLVFSLVFERVKQLMVRRSTSNFFLFQVNDLYLLKIVENCHLKVPSLIKITDFPSFKTLFWCIIFFPAFVWIAANLKSLFDWRSSFINNWPQYESLARWFEWNLCSNQCMWIANNSKIKSKCVLF